MKKFEFKTTHVCAQSGARTGVLTTPHGNINTPVFMPVGTRAAVKALSPQELKDTSSQIILANTYHLMLRPGEKIIKQAGGLHKFMGWDRPILTDSGGFQVFSLSGLRKITEEGARFKSHIDGREYLLSPETAMRIQSDLGADIVMAFDECCEGNASYEVAKKAVDLTLRWLKRSYDAFYSDEYSNKYQMLFPIVQGNVYKDLRNYSLENTIPYAKCGIAIGGLSVGEPKPKMYEMLDELKDKLPSNMPHYLMGIGSPDSLIEGVFRGIDMFDCVLPTRIARNGTAFTSQGALNMKNAKYITDFIPLDSKCTCYACTNFSRGYLRHLFNVDEILGGRLVSLHNLHYLNNLMMRARNAINNDKFLDFYNQFKSSEEYNNFK
ncbi:MAG: tRNA guanosine(34) transglycosylase Tgt [Firmicutes bacterium]|nr:tRNA guanosine(34) transglycosylase Tgt [Bacillota bacterium]